MRNKTESYSIKNLSIMTAIGFWSIVLLFICFSTGIQHDYVWYLHRWENDHTGQNPWALEDAVPGNVRINPYGPVHVLLGYLILFSPEAPKIFMLVNFLIANFFFLKTFLATCPNKKYLIMYGLIIPANFLLVTVIAIYGLNDTLVSTMLLYAIIAKKHNKLYLVGILLGLATLLKFYPIIIALFWCNNRGKFELKILISTLSTTVLGLILTTLIWGKDIFYSLAYNIVRIPDVLSPFSGVNNLILDLKLTTNDLYIIKLITSTNSIIQSVNSIITLLVCTICFLICVKKRLSTAESGVIGLFILLLFYKAGHPQFYVGFFAILLELLLSSRYLSKLMLVSLIPIVSFLSIYQILFFLTKGYSEIPIIDKYVSLIFLSVILFCLKFFSDSLKRNSTNISRH